jgi:two-component system, chemotaxis family, chemotaxis protein CheV
MKVTLFGQYLERFVMAQQTGILLAAGTNEMEIVEFYLDELLPDDRIYRGSYGINVAKVVEIIQQPKVTPIPMAPPGVLGTFISRGKVILLVDLAVRLGKKKPESESNPLAIVTEFNTTATAFVVSGVNRIHRLAWGRIEPAGVFLDSINCSITGVVKLEDHSVLILDMEKVLAELNPECAMTEDAEDDTVVAGARYTALVADDSFSIRNILAGKLAKAGFEVLTANDGSDAWEHLQELKARSRAEGRAIQEYLQIVISDIEMPQMDGYSLCQSVKKDPVLQALPVILFSSLINEKQLHKGLSVGADAQINKPESSNMAQRARELIEEYRGGRK